jgi:hypothetical protein
MAVFGCAACGAVLTAPVSRVALPVHAYQKYGNGVQLPVLMEAGTYAVDPEPSGPPGAVVIAPGDAHGTILVPERAGGYCCGLDWGDGPNLACLRCGEPVGNRIDDCSLWQAVWLEGTAVRRLDADEADRPATGWETLVRERESLPPVDANGRWRPEWEAAVGAALAHLLAASHGVPVAVPDGLLADTFGRALDLLLPSGPPERSLTLAGPGLHSGRARPRTGSRASGDRGGLAAGRRGGRRAPPVRHVAAAGLPRRRAVAASRSGRADRGRPARPSASAAPAPALPERPVRLHADARRLPAVRAPWLRTIHDRVVAHPYSSPF